jgi:hypothetical protein
MPVLLIRILDKLHIGAYASSFQFRNVCVLRIFGDAFLSYFCWMY